MISYQVILPYVYQPYLDDCIVTLKLPPEHVNVVDNTIDNRGVGGSWNIGIELMKEKNCDWLIILSSAMRFGEAGGLDMIEQLEKHPDADLIHFAHKSVPEQPYIRGKSWGYADGVLGWHCTAINKRVIEAVGKFDPNFYPAYFEDIDYDLRIDKAMPSPTVKVILPIDARSESTGHGVALAGIQIPNDQLIAYFATKWGRHPNASQLGSYDRPFNDPNNSVAFFPPAHGEIWDE